MSRVIALLSVLLALLSANVHAAIALVNSATETTDNYTTDATAVVTVPATTIGNLVVVVVQYASTNRTVSSVTGGATYTSLHRHVDSGGGESGVLEIFAGVATSSVTSITVVLSGNDAFGGSSRTTALEFSGATATEIGTSVDQEVTSATAFSLGSITPSTTDTVFVVGIYLGGNPGTWTEDADFTTAFSSNTGRVAYRIQNASATAHDYTPSWTTTRNAQAAMVALGSSASSSGLLRRRRGN